MPTQDPGCPEQSGAPPILPQRAPVERLREGLTLTVLLLALLVFFYVILRELTLILRPLFVAILLCYVIMPLHRALVRLHIRSSLAYVLIVLLVLGSMYGISKLAFLGMTEMSAALPAYMNKLEIVANAHISKMRHWFDSLLPAPLLSEGDGVEQNGSAGSPATATSASPDPVGSGPVTTQVAAPRGGEDASRRWQLISGERLVGIGRTTLQTFAGFFTGAMVVLFYVIFLLLEKADFERRLENAFGHEQASRIRDVFAQINIAIAHYLATKTFVSVLVGVLSGAILYAFNVKFAMMLGVLTFFVNFVPYLGSIFAVALSVGMAFVQFEEFGRPAAILALLFIAQQGTGAILEPKILGQRLGVSPLMILLSLGFWGMLWGVPGMLLAAPLLVTVKIILSHLESTRPIARLISSN